MACVRWAVQTRRRFTLSVDLRYYQNSISRDGAKSVGHIRRLLPLTSHRDSTKALQHSTRKTVRTANKSCSITASQCSSRNLNLCWAKHKHLFAWTWMLLSPWETMWEFFGKKLRTCKKRVSNRILCYDKMTSDDSNVCFIQFFSLSLLNCESFNVTSEPHLHDETIWKGE